MLDTPATPATPAKSAPRPLTIPEKASLVLQETCGFSRLQAEAFLTRLNEDETDALARVYEASRRPPDATPIGEVMKKVLDEIEDRLNPPVKGDTVSPEKPGDGEGESGREGDLAQTPTPPPPLAPSPTP